MLNSSCFFKSIVIIINFILLNMYFYFNFTSKFKYRKLNFFCIITAALLAIAGIFTSCAFTVIFTFLISFIYIFLCYHGKTKILLLTYLKSITVWLIAITALYIVITVFFEWKLSIPIYSYPLYKLALATISLYILFSLLYHDGEVFHIPCNSYKKTLSVLLIILTTVMFLLVYVLFQNQFGTRNINDILLFTFLFIITTTIIVIHLYYKINMDIQENTFRLQKLEKYELEQQYYADISDKLFELSALRHDFKNHLSIIQNRIIRHEYSRALEYIKSLANLTIPANEIITAPNTAVSSILSIKLAECKKHSIHFSWKLDFKELRQISDLHIIVILGNILDNAIEASSPITVKNKLIEFSMIQIDSQLDIECQNHYIQEPKKSNGGFLSSKRDNKTLGTGLKNVMQTIEQYHGQISYSYSNQIFHIRITIPNY